MLILILQLAALVAIAFVAGCVLGRLMRRTTRKPDPQEQIIIAAALSQPAPTAEEPATIAVIEVPVAEKILAEPEELRPASEDEIVKVEPPVSIAEPATVEDVRKSQDVIIDHRPPALMEPRRGKADPLVEITGIGEAVQGMLFARGIYHFDQIAGWSSEQAVWIDNQLGFRGRVSRENWIEQAHKLLEIMEKPAGKPRKDAEKGRKPAVKSARKAKA